MRFLVLFVVLAALLITGIHTLDVGNVRYGGFPNDWGGWIIVAAIGLVVIGFGLATAARQWSVLRKRTARADAERLQGPRAGEQPRRVA